MYYMTKTKECRKKSIYPFLINPPWESRPLSPLSFSGTLDFLSTYLEIDSLNLMLPILNIHIHTHKGNMTQQ